MASIDKVKVGDTTYDVSLGATGTLSGYTSSDNVTPPPAWDEVNTISSGDTNSSIFTKLTSMVKNVRWLYNKLGNTDISSIGDGTVSGAVSSLQSVLGDKAELPHTHTVSDLPVTNDMQANATTLIPSSAAVYSLYTTMSNLSTEIAELEEFVNRDDPNTRYESKDLGTWSSLADVDAFMSIYNYDSNYKDGDTLLSLGNYVTIQDGTYNVQWVIAGFDMEHNQTAADGTVYDNGYGICMIPKTSVTTAKWTSSTTSGGYKSSYIHTTTLPTVVTNLKTVLGTHVVNRNVLLSSSVGSTNTGSTAYTWTTADATLMSVGQCTGTFASHNNKYDDGEANYKLPLFNYEDYVTGSSFWWRGVGNTLSAWHVDGSGRISAGVSYGGLGVRPLIYLR